MLPLLRAASFVLVALCLMSSRTNVSAGKFQVTVCDFDYDYQINLLEQYKFIDPIIVLTQPAIENPTNKTKFEKVEIKHELDNYLYWTFTQNSNALKGLGDAEVKVEANTNINAGIFQYQNFVRWDNKDQPINKTHTKYVSTEFLHKAIIPIPEYTSLTVHLNLYRIFAYVSFEGVILKSDSSEEDQAGDENAPLTDERKPVNIGEGQGSKSTLSGVLEVDGVVSGLVTYTAVKIPKVSE